MTDIHLLQPDDVDLMNALLQMFGEVFDDEQTYTARRPGQAYLRQLLSGDSFMALVAMDGEAVVGGLAAYELKKFEQERSEVYIYDLAVRSSHRRQGVATALIGRLGAIAAERGAWVMFVQADTQPEDEPAIALYTKLGVREDVLHFDIGVGKDD
ncbi:AAC(3)-I family aminoglycoside N-acetyltransferase [Hydrogenophaga sp. 5NK40-0174]|uniref:AAC(3)-I family aminoglycoside N-acetyltransferase n=1 Tax=Hydrogenophaga sp. 5NK40-0174 TaxID=3127649 RepID=UPI00310BEE5F